MVSDISVAAHGVTRDFGRFRAVDQIDLEVRRGEIFGLLGPNGSGKTTLIRMLTGILKPNAGSIMILGRKIPDISVMSRVGYMTQAIALYEDLTVRENVVFFASMCGVRDVGRIDAAIDLADLADRAKSRVRNLSEGMKRRTSLACALVHEPEVLLLDEPTAGVDPRLRASFWDYFKRIAEAGKCLIVSSHVMDEAERCTRFGFIRHGRLIATGNYHELIDQAKARSLEEAFLRFTEGGADT